MAQHNRCFTLVSYVILFASIQTSSSAGASHSAGLRLAAYYQQNNNELLRQNAFLEWIASIFFPTTTTTTTTPSTPQRECAECTCGTINTIRRIVGGHETKIHQYPWMAMLLSNGRFYCGATLINDLYVVTASHCIKGFNQAQLSVHLLEHNRNNSSMDIIERHVVWLATHESYNSRTFDNDVALLRLSEPIKMSDRLRPVCLPEAGNTFAGETSVVTGWGALSQGGQLAEALQEVQVPVLSQEQCRSSGYDAKDITDNMLCAGFDEGGKDACQGDSGGPLHVSLKNNSNAYQLAGVVSWGEGCAKPKKPGVYTRVTNYLTWFEDRTRDACKCQLPKEGDEGTTYLLKY